MQIVHKLETKVAQWLKNAPHLPPEFRKWLAENSWWLTLIGVIIGALAIFPLLSLTIFASGLTATFSAYYPYAYGAQSGLVQASLWTSLGFYVVVVVLEALAVSPLKNMKKSGWDLLFLTLLVSVTSSIVNVVLTYSLGGLFGAALAAVIGSYVLFEIRGHFSGAKK